MPAVINDIITKLLQVEQGVVYRNVDGSLGQVRVRDLDDTPVTLNQGDCPQTIHVPGLAQERRLTFTNPEDGLDKGEFVYEIVIYFVDSAENLGIIWQSRPSVTSWVSDFVDAIQRNDYFWNVNSWCQVRSTGAQDGLKYNGLPFRGATFRLRLTRYG